MLTYLLANEEFEAKLTDREKCARVFFLSDEEMISSVRAICAGALNDKLRDWWLYCSFIYLAIAIHFTSIFD